MKYEYNPFISPVSGKFSSSSQLPFLKENRIFAGDRFGKPQSSVALMDIKIDLGFLLRQNKAIKDVPVILSKPHALFEHSQALSDHPNGVLGHTEGNIKSFNLEAAIFPDPTGLSPNLPIPNPTFDPAVPMDWLMSGPILPQVILGTSNTTATSWDTTASSSFAFAQVKIAQLLKRFDKGGFVVSKKTIDYSWPNPATSAIPPAMKTLYGMGDSYTFENAQALDSIPEGAGDVLLVNTAEGKLYKRADQQDDCCDDIKAIPLIANKLTQAQKDKFPKAISIEDLSKTGWIWETPSSGFLKTDSHGQLAFSSNWEEFFKVLAISATTSVVTNVGYDIFKSLLFPEGAVARFVFDVARVVTKTLSPHHEGYAHTGETPEITSFRGSASNTTDMIATMGVLRATKILVGQNYDGTPLLGYSGPIRGAGYLEFPEFADSGSWWNDISKWWWGDDDPPPAQLNLEFIPQEAVSFNEQRITHLQDPLNSHDATTKQYVDERPLRTWTNATRPSEVSAGTIGLNADL